MGNGMNKILPGLFLGNFKDARDAEQLSKNNVTHILSIHDGARPMLEGVKYLCIPAADSPSQNLTRHFKESIKFIHECRLRGESCLVHCLAGVSRSVTLVVAYVMTITDFGWEDALSIVRASRSCANPNMGFQRQLQEFEKHDVDHIPGPWLASLLFTNRAYHELIHSGVQVKLLFASQRSLQPKKDLLNPSMGSLISASWCRGVWRRARGMNLESGECGMSSVSCGNGKLRQWLIDQIDSGKYPGLVWENDEKSIFRIPWKHAGKQDYNREEDAALFKAWALFKGKFREGIDKPDPPTWKTRLRCALNKSNDFEELVERSQLDISDPYKVYRIVPEGAKKGAKQLSLEDQQIMLNHPYTMTSPYTSLQAQVSNYMVPHERNWRDFAPEQPHPDIPYQCQSVPFAARSHHWQGPACENGCQVTGTFYACAPSESQTPGIPIEPSIRSGEALALSDCRLHICLYYREILVKEMTTSSPEGCRISHAQNYEVSSLDQVIFPYPEDNGQRKNIEKLLSHLERGVILWMAPDGLYAKRLCQSRIYWDGPLALCSDRPNKLEREQTCKLFDTQQFLAELQAFAHHGRPLPRFQVALCFGEEFPDPQRQRKLITAHVEPMFARQLYYFAQQNSGHFLRGYDLPEHVASPEDYHRSIRHSSIQE
ncbi:interferon regulatory factor 4 isoform X2 [Dermochelys coriacea]|uniref:interferon regulatory factor 4 isoform X2 n=1 Tax=Dermochelys coriacea TaxID=27794 RepID=UPI001CA8F5A7|nr:interferon regulatory factor 4 isoform X2 [Dermochelys coriacea]